MTSKTQRWLMGLPLVLLPFTVAPSDAMAGEIIEGPTQCFASVSFTKGGLSGNTNCALAIVDAPGLPMGTQHIVDSSPFFLPGDLHTGLPGSSGPFLEEFVNDAGVSITGFHVEWGFGLDIGFEDIGVEGEFFDTVELMGDPGAFTGVWFTDASGFTGVHGGESFFLLTRRR